MHSHAFCATPQAPYDDQFAGHRHADNAMLSTQLLHLPALQVFLNGSRVPVKTFQDYVNLYLFPGTQNIYEKLGDRWEVCISLAEQGQFQQASSWAFCCWYCIRPNAAFTSLCHSLQVSFVNSICTVKGGTHVDLIANQICKCVPNLMLRPLLW